MIEEKAIIWLKSNLGGIDKNNIIHKIKFGLLKKQEFD